MQSDRAMSCFMMARVSGQAPWFMWQWKGKWREGGPEKKSGIQASEPAPPVTYILQIWPTSERFHSCHSAPLHDGSHTRAWRTFSFQTITQGSWGPHGHLLDCHLSRKMWPQVPRVWRMLATTLTCMEMCECLNVSRNGDAARTKGDFFLFFNFPGSRDFLESHLHRERFWSLLFHDDNEC